MSPRIGRPTDAKKSRRMELRLSEVEEQQLISIARTLELSKTETIKRALELVYKTLDYYDTGQLLDAISVRAEILRKKKQAKPSIISEEEWKKRQQDYERMLKENELQISMLANMLATQLSQK